MQKRRRTEEAVNSRRCAHLCRVTPAVRRWRPPVLGSLRLISSFHLKRESRLYFLQYSNVWRCFHFLGPGPIAKDTRALGAKGHRYFRVEPRKVSRTIKRLTVVASQL